MRDLVSDDAGTDTLIAVTKFGFGPLSLLCDPQELTVQSIDWSVGESEGKEFLLADGTKFKRQPSPPNISRLPPDTGRPRPRDLFGREGQIEQLVDRGKFR